MSAEGGEDVSRETDAMTQPSEMQPPEEVQPHEAGKRTRSDEDLAAAKRIRSGETGAYLKRLLDEEVKIIPFATVLPECSRLLQEEIARVRGGGASTAPAQERLSVQYDPERPSSPAGVPDDFVQSSGQASSNVVRSGATPSRSGLMIEMVENRETTPGMCKTSCKVLIPVERAPGFNFIGRLLGPRGNTLKDMQAESGCRMTIRGTGSVKLKSGETERSLAQQPQHQHLLEPLHIVVEFEGPINGKDAALSKVESRLAALCTPPDSEEGDEIKKNQLRQLAMLNGTYNDKQNGKPNRPRPQGAQAMQGMQGMQGMQAMQGMQGMQARPAQAFQNPYAGGAAFPAGAELGMETMGMPTAFQQAFAMAQAAQMSQMGTPGAQQQAYLSMSQAQPQPDPTAYPYNYGQY